MIYMDNAATSLPKPEQVKNAIYDALENAGNPGRGTHSYALWSSVKADEVRRKVARLFNIENPLQIAFTMNATHALNIAVNLCYGKIITTQMEHNSVLRPVATRGCFEIVSADIDGHLDVDRIKREISDLTGAVIMTHASNVTGEVYDIEQVGEYCRKKGIVFIVDASQSAGIVPIDVQKMNIDVLCFTGHKGLFGIQGTGGIYVDKKIRIKPFMSGGTGTHSFTLRQPFEMPECLEAGTINTHGIASLGAGIDYISEIGIEDISEKHRKLGEYFYNNASKIPGIKIYTPQNVFSKKYGTTGIVTLNLKGIGSGELGMILGREGICTRAGYHCAPLAHRAIGTEKEGGALRFSLNHFNTENEVDMVVKKLMDISANYRK